MEGEGRWRVRVRDAGIGLGGEECVCGSEGVEVEGKEGVRDGGYIQCRMKVCVCEEEECCEVSGVLCDVFGSFSPRDWQLYTASIS